ncbi:MAG: sigma 54-interacting transcriptional regulator [Oligoflexales bacterium]
MDHQQVVRWEEFDKIHVVRRLKQLIARWWRVQINFTDEKGFLRGVPEGRFFNPLNDVCQKFTDDVKGYQHCIGSVRDTAAHTRASKTTRMDTCHAGFSTLSVPIEIENQYLGCVFGDGFLIEESKTSQIIKIKNAFLKSFPTELDCDKWIDSIPILSSKDVENLTELIHMVVEEILMAQVNIHYAEEKVEKLQSELGERYSFHSMVGKSSPMQQLYKLIERVCESSAIVLIQGENGTGKELIAKALHYNSPRKKENFLAVNCGAFNENLLESELFGHAKGAFTGAIKEKQGLFASAHKGTLFLDEIGETSLSMQVKLLRVLQEGTYTPVGSTQTLKSQARIVCATNRDLQAMVVDKTFREDLFYRLNVINLSVPALRDRSEDIPLLTEKFLKNYAEKNKEEQRRLDQSCVQIFLSYEWPGNVRELENEIERLCVLSQSGEELSKDLISPRILTYKSSLSAGKKERDHKFLSLKDAIQDLEKEMIESGLQRTRYNKSQLARELGISRASLITKVERYGLDKRNFSEK